MSKTDKKSQLKALEQQAEKAKGEKRSKLLKQAANLRYVIKNMGMSKKQIKKVARNIVKAVSIATDDISTAPFSDSDVIIRMSDTQNRGEMVITKSDRGFHLFVELKETNRTGWLIVNRKPTLKDAVSEMASYLLSNCETDFYKE
jgi:hypothetical protein